MLNCVTVVLEESVIGQSVDLFVILKTSIGLYSYSRSWVVNIYSSVFGANCFPPALLPPPLLPPPPPPLDANQQIRCCIVGTLDAFWENAALQIFFIFRLVWTCKYSSLKRSADKSIRCYNCSRKVLYQSSKSVTVRRPSHQIAQKGTTGAVYAQVLDTCHTVIDINRK